MRIVELDSKALFEQPQLVPPEEFGLDDPRKNQIIAAKLIKKSNLQVLWTTDTHIMGMTGRGSEGYYILYNKTVKQLDYLVRYETQKYNFIGHFVTQVAIWRNMDNPITRNLSKDVFFNNILPMRGAIVSDRQQTSLGRRFWLIRMGDADDMGMRVGLIDIHQAQINWCPLGTYNTWFPEQMKYWSPAKRSADFRFIIATPEIAGEDTTSSPAITPPESHAPAL